MKKSIFKTVGAAVAAAVLCIGCNGNNGTGNGDDPTPTGRQFIVAFNTDGGTPAAIASITVDSGAAIGASNLPSDPTKSGYTFAGWFSGNTQYTAATVIKDDVTLTAKWETTPPPESAQFIIAFDTDGGTPAAIASVTVDSGAAIGASKLPSAPTKTDYTFVGWFSGDTQYTATTIIKVDVTLTAKWEAVPVPPTVTQFIVAFNTDGGTPAAIASVTVDSGAAIGASKFPSAPTKTGYTFEGWFSGDTRYTAATAIKVDVTLTAKWTDNGVGGGTFTDSRDGKTYRTVTIGTQTWMAENLNYDVPYGNDDCYNGSEDNCAKYGRLYTWGTAVTACPAGWRLPTSNEWSTLVSFVGGSAAGAGMKLKSATGWNWNDKNEISGNGTDNYGFSALPGGVATPNVSGNDNGFVEIGYTGCWWDSGAYLHRMRYDETIVYNLGLLSTWGGSVRCVQDDAPPPPPAVKQFTVAFNTDGGTPATIASVTVDSGTAIGASKLPSAPTKTGYTFEGWFSGNTQYTATTVIIGAVTLTAKWEAVSTTPYTITFDPTGGTVTPTSGTTGADRKLASLPVPAKDGYAFVGWFTAATNGTAVTTATTFTADATIYAQWEAFSGGHIVNGSWTWSMYTDVSDDGTSSINISESSEAEAVDISGNVTGVYQYGYAGVKAFPNAAGFENLKTATSISFNVTGDGKTYKIILPTSNITDYCYYLYRFTTTKDTERTVTVPIANFTQPEWGESKNFNQSLIWNIMFETNDEVRGAFNLTISNLKLNQ